MLKRILIDFMSTQAVSYRMGSVEIFHKNALFFFSILPLWELSVSRGEAGCVKTGTCFLLLKS